jgi:flavin reductase (DIM6/NTAB) family NADH-FMN oxidoreductase RutF
VTRRSSKGVGRFFQHYPAVVAVVTARAGTRANGMPATWHSAVSLKPPLFGVAVYPKWFTHDLILEAGEFGVNFLPFQKVELIAALGGCTGRTTDKFDRFGIELVEGKKTSAPVLAEAYAAFECRLVERHTYGDHSWFVGEILCAHLLEGALTEKGTVNLQSIEPTLYLGADLYVTATPQTVREVSRKRPVER